MASVADGAEDSGRDGLATPSGHDGSIIPDGSADRQAARPDAVASVADGAEDSGRDALATPNGHDGSTVLDGAVGAHVDAAAPASDRRAEVEPSCLPTGTELCDGKDNDCDGIIDNGFAWQGMPVGTACYPGVGACLTMGVVVCASPSTATCSVVPGEPNDSYQTGAAANGSWDWNCNNNVDRRYPLASCEMFTALTCPNLGWEPKTGEGGDCGQDLIQRSCFAAGSTCQSIGSEQMVTEGCK